MTFEIEADTWQTGTRPCTFSLALDGGSVFADFDVCKEGLVSLVRISFDGYGCCNVEQGDTTSMSTEDSSVLLTARADETLNTAKVRSLLRRYFAANSKVLWQDALAEYGLLSAER